MNFKVVVPRAKLSRDSSRSAADPEAWSTRGSFAAISKGMFQRTDDLRIRQVRPLIPPAILHEEIPISERASNVVAASRAAIADALQGQDSRLVVIAGPCSIHDTVAALEFGERLARLAERYADHLIVVMRTYFEKPRTSVGWKGLINDPDLDESFHINKGCLLYTSPSPRDS